MISKNDDSEILSFEQRRQLFVQEWLKFESELAEGSDGSEELCEMLFNNRGRNCPKCQAPGVVRIFGTRYVNCGVCFAKSSLTANTLFHNARRPKAWLGAIRMLELGLEFSAHMLAVIAKVSYATAWEIMKKLDEVLSKNLSTQSQVVSSKIFESVYMKRSRETPAREHPKSEQRIAEKEQRKRNKDKISSCNKRELEILNIIGDKGADADLLSEKLGLSMAVISAQLMMLELGGLLERSQGEIYKCTLSLGNIAKLTGTAKKFVKKFINNLRLSVRGISRKYVHLYLARFWCCVDRDRWTEGTLLAECLKFQPDLEGDQRRGKAPLMVPFPSFEN